jgi:hypothetical protein
LTLLIAVVGISPAFAQEAEQRRLDAIAREGRTAVRRGAQRAPAEQTRPTNPPPPGTRVELTLDEAVKRALERNLDIASSG